MGVQQRIQGLFSGGDASLPQASEDESGLRERPQRENVPDLSDQAVELASEEGELVVPSEAPWGRVGLTGLADRLEPALPPALPVPLSRRSAPPLPLPLTRRSAPSLEDLGAAVRRPSPAAPRPADDRIDLEEVARIASTAPPPRWEERTAPSTAAAGSRRGLVRALGLFVGALALVGAGWVGARLGGSAPAEQEGALDVRVASAGSAIPATEPQGDVDAVGVVADGEPTAVADGEPTVAVAVEETEEVRPTVRLDEMVVARTHSRAQPEPARERAPAAVRAPARVTSEPAAPPAAPAQPEQEAAAAAPESATPAEDEAAEAARLASLPEAPSREDVLAAIQSVESAVKACGEGHFGVAPVRITAVSSGRVTTAVVTGGSVLGTPAGSCIAREARRARFPEFRQARFVVEYPFQL